MKDLCDVGYDAHLEVALERRTGGGLTVDVGVFVDRVLVRMMEVKRPNESLPAAARQAATYQKVAGVPCDIIVGLPGAVEFRESLASVEWLEDDGRLYRGCGQLFDRELWKWVCGYRREQIMAARMNGAWVL